MSPSRERHVKGQNPFRSLDAKNKQTNKQHSMLGCEQLSLLFSRISLPDLQHRLISSSTYPRDTTNDDDLGMDLGMTATGRGRDAAGGNLQHFPRFGPETQPGLHQRHERARSVRSRQEVGRDRDERGFTHHGVPGTAGGQWGGRGPGREPAWPKASTAALW